ncbi:CRISPR-associated protein Cas5 [Algoriphagus pacificus]|uniref:CRISPR-associated protein Cas5 n=1 Tax=Algoriphagus pacificus TaxID=2811234 RepID=A0ABS3CLV8_9BACT|nr:CRISPR-associated protein Cas5 [Algoriphagus pacificus]MBN7818083.1 CRISPR-associated protein Cas5 [Algoriphagus pacificus]
MQCIIVELACQSCSFRIPEFQNFHRSYELPPPTTIIGFAGAALGLGPKESQEFFDADFEFGVNGSYKGKSNDLWKYQKLKGKEYISDILTREVLYEGHFNIVFASESTDKIERLQYALENPIYALTLGNSDGLCKVINVSFTSDLFNCDELKNCLVEGNLMEEVLNNPTELEFSLRDGVDPMSYEIPVAFEYDSNFGIRRVVKRKEFSFVGAGAHVKGLIRKGVKYKDCQIPLFKL